MDDGKPGLYIPESTEEEEEEEGSQIKGLSKLNLQLILIGILSTVIIAVIVMTIKVMKSYFAEATDADNDLAFILSQIENMEERGLKRVELIDKLFRDMKKVKYSQYKKAF